MNMQRCENGHFFDRSKSAVCPYCNPAYGEVNRTIPLDQATGAPDFGAGSFSSGFDTNSDSGIGHTIALGTVSEVTVAITPKGESGKSYDPVVGWLVCVDGPDKGTDYRIHSGNNSIGRGGTAQIRIMGDNSISKENMAVVTFDAISKMFYFLAREGRNVIRVNNGALLPGQSCELHAYDRILLGSSVMMFVPFCGGEFSWE